MEHAVFDVNYSNRFGLLVAPGSGLPIESEFAECSHNLHAIQPSSNHHSIHGNHHTKNGPCKKCRWDTTVQIPKFSELVSVFGVSRPDKPVFEVLPLYEPLAPLDFLKDFPSLLPSLLFPLPALLDHDLLCMVLRDHCSLF